jgi:transcriptional regulator with XRE-family HTH domain
MGAAFRDLRLQDGLRQQDLADRASAMGFKWTQPKVAAIESGRRQLTVEEFLVIPDCFAQPTHVRTQLASAVLRGRH